jgi:hypothetical protein
VAHKKLCPNFRIYFYSIKLFSSHLSAKNFCFQTFSPFFVSSTLSYHFRLTIKCSNFSQGILITRIEPKKSFLLHSLQNFFLWLERNLNSFRTCNLSLTGCINFPSTFVCCYLIRPLIPLLSIFLCSPSSRNLK